MRTKSSMKNMAFGIGSQLISILIAFFTRTIFIYILGIEYIGIDGLFANILAILSLANLGFDSAIIFSLYKPLNNNNNVEIKGYMNLYSQIYKYVGLFIFIVGILLIPFLPNMINSQLSIKENIVVIYLMFLLNSSISYLYVYKQSLLIANQKNYIISKIHTYFIIITNVLQISILVIFREYLAMLGIQLICRGMENIIISRRSDKEFPFLKDKNQRGYLSKDSKKQLYKNVYSMLLYKISGTIINSTDSIVISYFIGVTYVGIYSNYLLLISTVRTFVGYIFSSITASVGNLIVSNEEGKKKFIFNQIQFISFWVYGFSSIAFYILLNDFISIWLGNFYLLDCFTVNVIIVNFYTVGMQTSATIYRDTTGLFSVGKYRPIIAAMINIIVSIILAPKLGISGVLLGTIISRISVYFWFDPYVVHKYIFNNSSINYFIKYFKYISIVIFTGYITSLACNLVQGYSIYINFFVKLTICTLIPNIIFWAIFRKNKYFRYVKNIVISLFGKKGL